MIKREIQAYKSTVLLYFPTQRYTPRKFAPKYWLKYGVKF